MPRTIGNESQIEPNQYFLPLNDFVEGSVHVKEGKGEEKNEQRHDAVYQNLKEVNESMKQQESTSKWTKHYGHVQLVNLFGFEDKYIISSEDIVILRQLAEGNFGRVMKGNYHGITCAIKQMKCSENKSMEENEEARKQLLIEARKLISLKPHPNVVQLLGIVTGTELQVVLEFCDQGSLEDKLYGKIQWISHKSRNSKF